MALVLAALTAVTAVLTPGVSELRGCVLTGLRAHSAATLAGAVPPRVAAALIATKDSRFYTNPGVDVLGVARAATHLGGGADAGGATLEQQLAKEEYTPADSGLDPVEDVALAVKMDQRYSKGQLLSWYLDAVYYGDGAWGIVDAARHYFNRSPGSLSWAQAAMLAGLVQAPSAYDPHGHLTLARSRQHHVLDRLVAVHDLTVAEAAAVFAAPLQPAVPFTG